MLFSNFNLTRLLNGLTFYLGFMLMAYGVYFFIFQGVYHQDSGSSRWPTLPGRVVSSRLVPVIESDPKTQNTVTRYRPEVRYSYYFEQMLLEGSTIAQDDTGGDPYSQGTTQGQAAEVVKRFPLNSLVNVYYNPAAPYKVLLIPDPVTQGFPNMLLGGVLFIAGAFFFFGRLWLRVQNLKSSSTEQQFEAKKWMVLARQKAQKQKEKADRANDDPQSAGPTVDPIFYRPDDESGR